MMGLGHLVLLRRRTLLGPIRNLSQAMGKVAEGDLSQRIPVTSNDEVGELTGQFNNMVEGLREARAFPRDLRPLCRRERRCHHPEARGRGRAGRRDA
jgi:nitrogen fixation/metabolism regulation signal transduction histidine kinase